MATKQEITELLLDLRRGRPEAADELFPFVYDQLRDIAHYRLNNFRRGETLNTTALVHEAFLRLVDEATVEWNDRAHFFALASQAMRYVLVDYARANLAQKRGGNVEHVRFDDSKVAAEDRLGDFLVLNQALDKLAAYSDRLRLIVEYRFFGGLTYEEIAEVMQRSVPTVKRDWVRARAWLYRAMHSDEQPGL